MRECYGDRCDVYLLDANVLVSLLLGGKRPRRCLEMCKTQYLVPRSAIEELLELVRSEDFQNIVSRIERRID